MSDNNNQQKTSSSVLFLARDLEGQFLTEVSESEMDEVQGGHTPRIPEFGSRIPKELFRENSIFHVHDHDPNQPFDDTSHLVAVKAIGSIGIQH